MIWQQRSRSSRSSRKDGLTSRSPDPAGDADRDRPRQLVSLEDQLTALTGKAQAAIGEIEKKDKSEAQKLEQAETSSTARFATSSPSSNAQTYAVPPIFKQRLKHYIDRNLRQAGTKSIYKRKHNTGR